MAEIEVLLNIPTYGGEAMGRLEDGRAIFVPFALPGETVRARIVDEKRGFARAALLAVLNPSAQRITPRCIHFGVCGGCHYQMLPYPEQLKLKETVLRDQLTRIGKIQDPPLRPSVAAVEAWNYRNHIQFHLTADRHLGFVPAGDRSAESSRRSPQSVIPISECHLPEDSINALWPQLQFDAGAPLERVSLRVGHEMMLALESDSAEIPELEIETDISVVHMSAEDSVVLAGEDHILIDVLDRSFRVSAAGFFQVNTAMAEKMVTYLLNNLRVLPSTLLLDIYCGVGLFSAFFAPKVKQVIGIEISPFACEDFTANLHEFDNVDLYEASAETVLPELHIQPDIVIVDPPRAGLDKKALDAILKLNPETVAYISCDPSTLARDAARLIAGGYRLLEVTAFDLFPQTYHIESISIFER